MKGRGYYRPEGLSTNAIDYQFVCIRRAHELLALGYASLVPSEYSRAAEEDITDELVWAMNGVLDDSKAPPWMKWLSVHDDPGIHDDKRKGKRRRRVDIRIDSGEVQPRSRLSFEAKRLGPNHNVSTYLGDKGLRCFIDGQYGRFTSSAGMLGYVQTGKPED